MSTPEPLAPSAMDRRAFFDAAAAAWDRRVPVDAILTRLGAELEELGVGPSERVVDLGCGTGTLTLALLERLGPAGRVLAVDYSERMLDAARGKAGDRRARWVLADAEALPIRAGWADRVICFSTWPHFHRPALVARELGRILAPGGAAHVLHVDSRDAIARIHRDAGGPVRHDTLAPAAELAATFAAAGLAPVRQEDAEDRYLVTVLRAPMAGGEAS